MSKIPLPDSVTSDCYGNKIEVGDKVCFVKGRYIHRGEVVYFTPSGVSCIDTVNNDRSTWNIQTRYGLVKL